MRCSILLLLIAGCGSQPMSREEASLGPLAFDVPSGWTRSDWKQRGQLTAQWVPSDNERKESITLIRTERSPAQAKAGVEALLPVLAAAQRSLDDASMSKVTPIETSRGMQGARVEVAFRPPGLSEQYRRVHVVLLDGQALVHVMYTARELDDDLRALEAVLNTIRDEEG
jgi:hypothetical protein